MSKKMFISVLVLVGLVTAGYVVLLFRGNPHNDVQAGLFPGTMEVGHLVALDMAPLFVAKEAGYFEDEGIKVSTRFFANPGDNNAALAGGSIQLCTNPFTLAYLGANSGQPMRIISSAGGLGIIQVVIQGDYRVNSLQQLASHVKAHPNEKIKVGSLKGDTLDMILYKGFQDVGLTYDDFEMVWFNDLLAMVEAFRTKEIGILSHIKPYTTDLIVNYGAVTLTDNSEVWGEGTPNCTVIAMQGFIDKYPESIRRYLKAVRRGFQLTVDDPHRAVQLLDQGQYYKVDKDVLLHAFQTQSKKVTLKPLESGMMTCINDMVHQDYIKKPKAGILSLSLLEESAVGIEK